MKKNYNAPFTTSTTITAKFTILNASGESMSTGGGASASEAHAPIRRLGTLYI